MSVIDRSRMPSDKDFRRLGKLFYDLCQDLAMRHACKRFKLPLAPDTPEEKRKSRAQWRELWSWWGDSKRPLTAKEKRSIRWSMTRIGRHLL